MRAVGVGGDKRRWQRRISLECLHCVLERGDRPTACWGWDVRLREIVDVVLKDRGLDNNRQAPGLVIALNLGHDGADVICLVESTVGSNERVDIQERSQVRRRNRIVGHVEAVVLLREISHLSIARIRIEGDPAYLWIAHDKVLDKLIPLLLTGQRRNERRQPELERDFPICQRTAGDGCCYGYRDARLLVVGGFHVLHRLCLG